MFPYQIFGELPRNFKVRRPFNCLLCRYWDSFNNAYETYTMSDDLFMVRNELVISSLEKSMKF
tara:strand:- start:242 stop:430 length:189 start_codon:yes stop_codon:yes gene_type:complete